MRHALLLCLVIAAAAAADREAVTLNDGRTLVGVYDAEAGTVTLDGKGSAVIKVRADQVKARERAPEPKPAAVAVVASEPSPAIPKAAVKPPAPPISEQIADLQQRHHRELMAACRQWLEATDLKPLPVPKAGSDPKREADVAMVNAQLQALIAMKEQNQRDAWQSLNGNDAMTLRGTSSWWPIYEQLRDAKP